MFDKMYGTFEMCVDHESRISLGKFKPEIGYHTEIAVVRDDDKEYSLHLLERLDEQISDLKERSYLMPDEVYERKVKELNTILCNIVSIVRSDKDKRISLPYEVVSHVNDSKVILLGRGNSISLYPTKKSFDNFIEQKTNIKK